MSNIDKIFRKTRQYTTRQNIVHVSSHLIFTCATVIISTSVALMMLRSPWYGLVGLIPLFFFRPRSLMDRARELEEKTGLKGEIVNSLQLSKIPKDSKERYSRELIQAFIDDAAAKIEDIDVRRFVSSKPLRQAIQFVLVAIAFTLFHPAFFSERFWYSLNHRIEYTVSPGNAEYPKDADTDVTLYLWGVYVPKTVIIQLSTDEKTTKTNLEVQNGSATATVTISDPTIYRFEFFEHKTEAHELYPLEPLYIQNLSFRLQYPAYTGLDEETKGGRQLVVPSQTVVSIQGRVSEALREARFEFGDTIVLERDDRNFSGTFKVQESGNAILHLVARSELREQIRVYSIPDLAPLVDVFYPGANVNLPYDMTLQVGIRCSDDYGLSAGTFYYTFDLQKTENMAVRPGAFEDTVSFTWDLSDLGMLPGDEVSYYVQISDNSGQVTTSNTYYVYFPTMEQMYEEITEKESMLQTDMTDMKAEHGERMEEISRIREKLMKEREMSWADQEKLGEAIRKEEAVLEKINEWQAELEETIEKLKEGVILDQESIERLNEIARIMEEIAPEELKKALERLKVAMEQRPADIPRALEQVAKNQEELARALERSLEILKRYEQEEKLRQIAERAAELAGQQEEIEELGDTDEDLAAGKQQDVDQGIEELADMLNELAASEGLEQEIKDALKQMAQQMQNLQSASGSQKKSGLNNMAKSLQQLYGQLTQGRYVNLRENLLESLKQIIETSKAQEQLINEGLTIEPDMQQELIEATETIAESLFQQQSKSLFVRPQIGKGLARATMRMEEAQRFFKNDKVSKMKANEAMKELNLVARDILLSLEMMQQDGSSTGMSSFMQQLANITNGQMMLSQSLMNMLPIPVQGLSQAQKTQLQRLAARQRELRQALEALRGEPAAGQYGDMLDNMINDMQEMEQDLFQYKVSRELIERQKRVISRLLDSQRSIRKEDFAKRRKSKPGEDIAERTSPAALTQELGKDELREMLQQELRKEYPKEYELYIREYFKALLEER
jgi:hypothetical protein